MSAVGYLRPITMDSVIGTNMKLQDLPDCMLEQIFEYLSYDEIARKRLVSTKFDKICQGLLNIGFNKMMRQHQLNLKKIKSQLPRRESERRVHALAKHADILTCIETRISMLSMTYTKYIDLGLCCFIPGNIIDEVMAILTLVDSTNRPLRAHEVLQELRDISSMAIDHFDEQIAPNLKKSFCDLSNQKYGSSVYQIIQSPIEPGLVMGPEYSSDLLQAPVRDHEHRCQGAQSNRVSIVRLERRCESIMKCVTQVMVLQKKQARLIRNNTLHISELKTQLAEYRRRLEDFTGNAPPSQRSIQPISTSTPNHVSESTASNISSDSIEVLGSSSTSSGSMSSVIISPTATKNALIEPCYSKAGNNEWTYKNIKPRTATILNKRHLEEAVESCKSVAKNRRIDGNEDDE